MTCECYCHSNPAATCTVDGGYGIGCGPHDLTSEPETPRCLLSHAEPVEARHGLLCARHYHWIGDTLTQLEELWALRGHVVVHIASTRYDTSPKGTPDGSPAPGRIGVMAVSDSRMQANPAVGMTYERNWNGRVLETNGPDMIDVPGVLFSWVRMVVEEQAREVEEAGSSLTASVRFLRRERIWIARQLWVDDYASEIHDAHRALASATGAGMWPQSIGKCPNCQARLYPTVGIDEVSCRRCKTVWTGVNLARLLLIHEQEKARKEAG